MLTQQTFCDKTYSKTEEVFKDKKIIVRFGGHGIHPGMKTSGFWFPFQWKVNKWSVDQKERLQHLFSLSPGCPMYVYTQIYLYTYIHIYRHIYLPVYLYIYLYTNICGFLAWLIMHLFLIRPEYRNLSQYLLFCNRNQTALIRSALSETSKKSPHTSPKLSVLLGVIDPVDSRESHRGMWHSWSQCLLSF